MEKRRTNPYSLGAVNELEYRIIARFPNDMENRLCHLCAVRYNRPVILRSDLGLPRDVVPCHFQVPKITDTSI